ncbi:glycosyltransferase family 2 protein [Pelagovum pacificum]|uniref:Glycosyltransferase n=1 Tax=Pelagovum pacificum TaxID=2588711 RepID=A0A5C5GBJ8_9RHOB|nr:glycosyltransferase family 2 protein [Pelagovum pacificum]QQA44769.1 glycosyltransferase [Pelagovum pacificum]TNY32123.1 glycosyltransferase [Pelagovum pacificum]
MELQHGILREAEPGTQKIILAFSFRYDAHLIPPFLENLGPSVHEWVALDDRVANEHLTDERIRRSRLLAACRDRGADWILAADPDERFEDRLKSHITRLARPEKDVIWSFHLREMYSPTAWRSDGLWGRKQRPSLYPITPDAEVSTTTLHGHWFSYDTPKPARRSGLAFYHLRMIDPERRRLRRALYATADPDRVFQEIGYDYLDDERTLTLEEIAPENAYTPLHEEDGGLWAPSPEALGTPTRDRNWNRFAMARRYNQPGDAAVRSLLADDILAEGDAEGDPDARRIAAAQKARAGDLTAAIEMLEQAGESAAKRFWLSRLRARMGARSEALADAQRALELAPSSDTLRKQVVRLSTGPTDFADDRALWRQWISGAATIREGSRVRTDAPITAVVIGYRAPPDLATAVRSLVTQDEPAEIVVVNSGGGSPDRVLGELVDQVRLIAVEERLFVGAARNIGIDASTAPVVAFLASDCAAEPGWVSGRLVRHATAPATGSAVIAHDPHNPASLVGSVWMHWRRWPNTEDEAHEPYGLSYDRWLFGSLGYFSSHLRVAEDTAFNRRVHQRFDIDWSPEIVTTHRYARSLPGIAWDIFKRGRRRAADEFASIQATGKERWPELKRRRRIRHMNSRRQSFRMAGVGRLKQMVVRQMIRVVSWADVAGLLSAARKTRTAGQLAAQAEQIVDRDPAGALRHVSEARRLCPQVPRFRLQETRTLARQVPPCPTETLVEAYQVAAGLVPNDPTAAIELYQHLLDRSEAATALSVAERNWQMAPHLSAHAIGAARAAMTIGSWDIARLYVELALMTSPWNPEGHSLAARLHERSGDLTAMKLRREAALGLAIKAEA